MFVKRDDTSLTGTGSHVTVDAGVIGVEEHSRFYSNDMSGPDVDDPAVTGYCDLLAWMGCNNLVQC